MGYHRAGFEVVGVDIKPQPHYPFQFFECDALEFITTYCADYFLKVDAIHASPPCQAYSVTKSLHKKDHPDLVGKTREILIKTGKPYVIENVKGSPLNTSLMLCGSMFKDLRVYRHRYFECNPLLYFPPAECNHAYSMPKSKGEYHTLDKQSFITCVGHNFQAESGRKAMGIDWMTRDELAQAIPPAYTEWIGKQLLKAMERC